jgi:hypothetical protein
MSRFQGFHRKINRRIELLEHNLGGGSVAEGMRILAITGEYPANPYLKREVECMVDMARAMANTIPKRGPSEPQEEIVQDRPLSETFESVETPEWIVEGGGNVSIRRFV